MSRPIRPSSLILIDANLLIYAWDKRSPHHELARLWLESILSNETRVALPWQSLIAFVRIVTDRRIFQHAQPVSKAWEMVQRWLACENVWIPNPGEAHARILGRLLQHLGGGGKLVPDAHLAALALEHGLTVCSADGDFARFQGLRWENPLAPL